MKTLSAYFIVRNAESTLQRALESVRPHVDELVVVDTGSEDRTCEIAAAYADVLTGFRWCDDFSAARNHALSLCTGDWAMWLDADDELVGGEALRPLVEADADGAGMYLLRYVVERAADGSILQEYWRERVARRELCKWEGRVHEVLMPTGQTAYARYEGAYVEHRRTEGFAASMRRNVRLLELQLADEPENTRTMFYLGRDLITIGERERGVEILLRYLELGSWPDEQHIAAQLIADCYRHEGRFQEALGTDASCVLLHPEWPHTWYALAKDAYYLQRWDWSIRFCETGQACPAPATNLFVSPSALQFDWMIYQVRALSMCGRVDEAFELTWRALGIRPGDPQHLYNLRYLSLERLKRLGVAPAAIDEVQAALP